MSAADAVRFPVRALRGVFVLNPVSGRPATRAWRRERLEAFLARHRLDAQVLVSLRPGHAVELARAAIDAGAAWVVSVGGDGTINEVASTLVGKSAVFGIIPCGSGNGLARDLALPLRFEDALELLLDARVRVIDSGTVNGLPFFNVAGLGFDAVIGDRFNRSGGTRGLATYFRIGLAALFTTPIEPLVVEPEGRPAESMVSFMTAIANSTQYGNNARIAPRARLDDGQLDVVVVQTRNPLRAVWLGLRAFAGTVDRANAVRTLQARAFTIRRAAAGPIHVDGEVHVCPATIEVRTVPGSLRVLVPAG